MVRLNPGLVAPRGAHALPEPGHHRPDFRLGHRRRHDARGYPQRGLGRSRKPRLRRLRSEEKRLDHVVEQHRPRDIWQHGDPDTRHRGDGHRYQRAGFLHQAHVGYGQQVGGRLRQRDGDLHRPARLPGSREQRRTGRRCQHLHIQRPLTSLHRRRHRENLHRPRRHNDLRGYGGRRPGPSNLRR